MLADHSEITPSPSTISRRPPVNEKIIKVMGKDSVSTEKLQSRLGLQSDELQMAEAEIQAIEEEKLERMRALENIRNKKESVKALEVLGHDPSTEKVKERLGISDEELKGALQENAERQEQIVIKTRRNSGQMDRKNTLKALEVLGYDPSIEKAMKSLGMQKEDFEAHQKQLVEQYEENMERKRSNSCVNKRQTAKAQKILGLSPSEQKLVEVLGIDEDQIKQYRQEQHERFEEMIRKKRNTLILAKKRNIQKALKVLGHDPSDQKIESKLGVDPQVAKKELLSLSLVKPPSTLKYTILGAAVALLTAACFRYAKM